MNTITKEAAITELRSALRLGRLTRHGWLPTHFRTYPTAVRIPSGCRTRIRDVDTAIQTAMGDELAAAGYLRLDDFGRVHRVACGIEAWQSARLTAYTLACYLTGRFDDDLARTPHQDKRP